MLVSTWLHPRGSRTGRTRRVWEVGTVLSPVGDRLDWDGFYFLHLGWVSSHIPPVKMCQLYVYIYIMVLFLYEWPISIKFQTIQYLEW